MASVLILQHRLLHYREQLFNDLRNALKNRGVDLRVLYGQSSNLDALRHDATRLDWGINVVNVHWRVLGRDLLWQRIPRSVTEVDLIIAMQENKVLSNYPLQLRARWSKHLFAFWGHGRNMQSVRPRGLRELWKSLFVTRVDWWFAYTADTERYLRSVAMPAGKITTLNNAIDGARFRSDLSEVSDSELGAARARLGISVGASVALFCSSLYDEKRIAFLIESARAVRQATPSFHLIVVGDGPDAGMLEAAAGEEQWFHWVGARTGKEKALYFRLAALQMFPGALGLHILDAFIAGQPIVTLLSSLHGPEIAYLEDGVNGRIVESDSVSDYAAEVVRLFADPIALSRLAERCRLDASRYTLENMVQRFADGIVECLVRNNRMPAPVPPSQA
jgi:glycosyltransferase involved in cell wall biosynthesis